MNGDTGRKVHFNSQQFFPLIFDHIWSMGLRSHNSPKNLIKKQKYYPNIIIRCGFFDLAEKNLDFFIFFRNPGSQFSPFLCLHPTPFHHLRNAPVSTRSQIYAQKSLQTWWKMESDNETIYDSSDSDLRELHKNVCNFYL